MILYISFTFDKINKFVYTSAFYVLLVNPSKQTTQWMACYNALYKCSINWLSEPFINFKKSFKYKIQILYTILTSCQPWTMWTTIVAKEFKLDYTLFSYKTHIYEMNILQWP